MKLPTETSDLHNTKGLCGIFCMFYIGSSFINYSCPKINIEPEKWIPGNRACLFKETAFSRKRFFRGGSPSASTSAPTADFSAFHFSRDFWSCSGEENVPRKTNGTLEEGKMEDDSRFLEESSLVPTFWKSRIFGFKTRKLRFNQHLQLQLFSHQVTKQAFQKSCRHQDAIGRPKLSAKATVSSQLNQVWPRRAAKTSWQNHAILWDKSHHNTNKSGPWTSEGAFFAEITWFPLNSVLRGSSHSLKWLKSCNPSGIEEALQIAILNAMDCLHFWRTAKFCLQIWI